MGFQPRLTVLPEPQKRLWPELAALPRSFVLYGGTALALRLGHRASVDFDFFAHDKLDHEKLSRTIPFLPSASVLHSEADTLTVSIDRGGPVKVSFFGGIDFGRIGEPDVTDDGTLRVASLLDVASTKVKVLLQRVEGKDYRDLAAVLRAGIPLERILAGAVTLYGRAFNPLMAQKTLGWFDGGDLASLSEEDRELLVRESARDLTITELPKSSARLD